MMHLNNSDILDLMKYSKNPLELWLFHKFLVVEFQASGKPSPLYSLYPNPAQSSSSFHEICFVPSVYSDLFILSIVISDYVIHLVTGLLFIRYIVTLVLSVSSIKL